MKKSSYQSTVTAVCTDCNGEGVIIVRGEHLGHGRYADDTHEQCETCEGTGLVSVNKSTTVVITPKRTKQ